MFKCYFRRIDDRESSLRSFRAPVARMMRLMQLQLRSGGSSQGEEGSMLRRDQGNAAAESLLAQARARSAARSDLHLRGFLELEALDPELRSQVLRQARRATARNWLVHAAALSWVAAYAATWYFLVPSGDKHSAATLFALGAVLPVPFFYNACARRQVCKILRSMATSTDPLSR
jgi:hypothetical protein